MEKITPALLVLLFSISLSAADVSTKININNTTDKGGSIHLAVFDSADSYKQKKPLVSKILKDGTAAVDLTLPEGEYMASVYIDVNGNGKMDANLVGMPKEPVGISNYDGKSIPGGFDKHKVKIGGAQNAISIKVVEIMGGDKEK